MISLLHDPAATSGRLARVTRVGSYAALVILLMIQSAVSLRLSQQVARREQIADEAMRTVQHNEKVIGEMRANLREREALLVEYQRNLEQMHAFVRGGAPIVVDEPPPRE